VLELTGVTVERTLVFLKPDAVIRQYTGARLLKELTNDREVVHYEVVEPGREFFAEEHYMEHEGREFYEWLVDYASASPVHVIIFEGEGVTRNIREQLGGSEAIIFEGEGVTRNIREQLDRGENEKFEGDEEYEGDETFPQRAPPDSLRGRYGLYGGLNAAHASEKSEDAKVEIEKWDGILNWDLKNHQERIDAYIRDNIDSAQVDPVRYREVTKQYIDQEISESFAREAFTTLLSRESDKGSDTIANMVDILIGNAEIER